MIYKAYNRFQDSSGTVQRIKLPGGGQLQDSSAIVACPRLILGKSFHSTIASAVESKERKLDIHRDNPSQLGSSLTQRDMQAMMQRTLSHSFAMSSGCKGAPSHHATPPMASAHTQTYINASKHCLSRQRRAVSAFSARLLHRSSRRTLAVRADADYGASWKESQHAFLVLVNILSSFYFNWDAGSAF
jgi:hypothetical protein